MDFDAIFQQINLRYEWVMSFCNFNSKSDGRRYEFFFSFNYSSSLSTSESHAKTLLPDSFECSSTPSEVLAIPCVLFGNTSRALFLKNQVFFCYGKIFLPNTRGPLGCLLRFRPKPCGGNNKNKWIYRIKGEKSTKFKTKTFLKGLI